MAVRLSTQVFARFSSSGYPGVTKDCEGQIKEVLYAIAQWMVTDAQMNRKIIIVLSKDKEGLELTRKNRTAEAVDDLMDHLDKLLENEQ